jgi:hypothetical protein
MMGNASCGREAATTTGTCDFVVPMYAAVPVLDGVSLYSQGVEDYRILTALRLDSLSKPLSQSLHQWFLQ